MIAKFDKALNSILVLAAVAIAIAVVRREFFADRDDSPVATRNEPSKVGNWDELLVLARLQKPSKAKVVVVEFMDVQCPFCREFHDLTGRLQQRYGEDMEVGLIHFPLQSHQYAMQGARAIECAGVQRQSHKLLDAAFAKQDSIGLKSWRSFAAQAEVRNLDAFDKCMVTDSLDGRIRRGLDVARSMQLPGTPSVIVNGWRFPVPPSEAQLDSLIKADLRRT